MVGGLFMFSKDGEGLRQCCRFPRSIALEQTQERLVVKKLTTSSFYIHGDFDPIACFVIAFLTLHDPEQPSCPSVEDFKRMWQRGGILNANARSRPLRMGKGRCTWGFNGA